MKKIKKFNQSQKLSWRRDDFERRIGFEGDRFVKVSALPSGLLAALTTVAFYVVLVYVPDNAFKLMFTERGWTPYAVVALGSWTFFLLWIKTRKIKLQRKPLKMNILPDDPDFVLTVGTVDKVLDQITKNADSPKDFILYRRIIQTLSNLRNIGRVSDVDALFRSQAEQDDNVSETSYSLVSGFLWAIPILGFIGTVIGLSQAIGEFTGVLTASSDMSELTPALKEVTAGLSTAFETTLVALSVALTLQLFATFVRKSEEELLDEISDYCTSNIVTKIRVEDENVAPVKETNDNPRTENA